MKSAVLLAGLNTAGITRVIEPVPDARSLRAHAQRFRRPAEGRDEVGGERVIIALHGEADLKPQTIDVPGDPSSAAFFIVAALLVPGSELTIENVGLNPTRAGLIDVLRQMGGEHRGSEPRTVGGEPVADLLVRHSALKGIEVDPAVAPSHDRRVPGAVRRRRARRGPHHHQRARRAAGQRADRLAAMADRA